MLKRLQYLFLIILIPALVACGWDDESEQEITKQKIDILWEDTVTVYLKDNLWETTYNYDAGQLLMVPLYYAFQSNDAYKIKQFDQFYNKYTPLLNDTLDEKRLKQLQFWYLASQYLVFSNQRGDWDNNKQLLLDGIVEYLRDLWFDRPIHVYGIHTIGLKERIIWKLDNPDYLPRYKRATFDEEFYSFTIAADLMSLNKASDPAGINALTDILNDAEKVFKSEVKYTDSGWLYQPGQWFDNEDFEYAGHTVLTDTLEPSPIEDIATDSSHSHRMPLWLTSLRNAYPQGSELYTYYQSLLDGFENQFTQIVFVAGIDDFKGMRMKNYMDGRNGIYRYRFHKDSTSAIKLGYEPYNLSGTLFTGFFPLMESSRLQNEYKKQCDLFPLEQNLIDLYMGLGPARASHPLVSMPDFYTNGFAELNCLMTTNMY